MAKKAKATKFELNEQQAKQPAFSVLTAFRFDSRLSDGAKILLSEIILLAAQKGYCYASNEFFAKLYQKTTRTIQNRMEALEEAGYIKREIIENENHSVSRKIFLTQMLLDQQPVAKEETEKIQMLDEVKPTFIEVFSRNPYQSESKKINGLAKEFGIEILIEAIKRSSNAKNNIVMYIIKACNTVKGEFERKAKFQEQLAKNIQPTAEELEIAQKTLNITPNTSLCTLYGDDELSELSNYLNHSVLNSNNYTIPPEQLLSSENDEKQVALDFMNNLLKNAI